MRSVEKLSRDEVRRRIGLAPADNEHSEPLHTWESPDWSILDDRRGDLPKFPADCLGKAFMTVRRAAKGAGVTDAHVAVPMLGIASSLIGVARRIQASTSWLEPCTTWCGIVGFSGTGKTPGLEVTKRALAAVERESATTSQSCGANTIPKLRRRAQQGRPGRSRLRRRSKMAAFRLRCRKRHKTPASLSPPGSTSLTGRSSGWANC